MILIKQPALTINSVDTAKFYYSMRYTIVALPGTSARVVVSCIRYWASIAIAQGTFLRHVIIKCHGSPGKLYVGGVGSPPITIGDVPIFSELKSILVSLPTIWLSACKPATGTKGRMFCSELANATGCRVIASEDLQWRTDTDAGWMAIARMGNNLAGNGSYAGVIDEYEGLVWLFDPKNGTRLACSPGDLHDIAS